ncbi:hypothetical protein DFP74_0954 [Nocardiopsis sp. Huas11]|uniref:DUF4350 domain-containing protein n=1 Tax=Nocardiopsis sp. Huas11 TaxID=2183912 RepID=UPI000EB58042|nr:DUF4350 domain-containing protein [Nocardiopsis sp. Huas11]RKS05359.1 hypothetical protein DFP74_0954 [Nocardiopsis sp. Huas11]
MTATVPPPTAPAAGQDRPPSGSGAARLWRSVRVPLVLVTALVVVSVLLSLGTEQFPEGYLEPDSVSPDGARALVRVLEEDRDVDVVRSSADAEDALAAADGDSVLVVFLDHRLLPEELDSLAAHETDTVLVQPTLRSLEAFAPGVDVTGRTEQGETLAPLCTMTEAVAAGDAEVGGELYGAPEDSGAVGCYPAGSGEALIRVENGTSTTTVLGTGEPFTNTELDVEGNAPLALNLMSAENVVWLRPDPPEQAGSATLVELLPLGLRWAAVPLVAALGLLALWRGRRLGPLVPESLPVVVQASETTLGRAALYRSRHARDRAALALRRGFLDRTVPKLGLASDAGDEAVVSALAARTGDDPSTLSALLHPVDPDPFTADDGALVRLADELDARARRLR